MLISELINQLMVSVIQHGDKEITGELRVVDPNSGEPLMGKRSPILLETNKEDTRIVFQISGRATTSVVNANENHSQVVTAQ